MKTKSLLFFKAITTLFVFMVFMFTINISAQNNGNNGQGIGGNTGATIDHSANVNENGNNGNANQGNHGQGFGNNAFGNQGNDSQNGRAGGQRGSDSIPLDGGLGILVLGAAAFGVKKLRINKNETI